MKKLLLVIPFIACGFGLNLSDPAFLAATQTPPPPASSLFLNVDVGNYPYASEQVGPAAASDGNPTDVWTMIPFNYDGYTPYSSTALKWSDGSISPVTAYGVGQGCWVFGTTTGSKMYDYYEFMGGGECSITFDGIPSGDYDVYVYAHGAATDQNSSITLTFGVTSQSATTTTPLSTGTGENTMSATWEEGAQYVVFRGVSLSGDLKVTAGYGVGLYSVINGVQLKKL